MELRRRFWIALGLLLVATAAWAFGFRSVAEFLDDPTAGGTTIGDYAAYVRAFWFGRTGGGFLVYLTVLLSLGGVATEERRGSLALTLSLPVPRSRWILSQAGVVAALVLALAAVSTLEVVLLGPLVGGRVNPQEALAGTGLIAFRAAGAIGLTLFFSALTGDVLKAALLSVGTAFLLHQPLGGLAVLRPWALEPGQSTWPPLAIALTLTVLGTAAAIVILRQKNL